MDMAMRTSLRYSPVPGTDIVTSVPERLESRIVWGPRPPGWGVQFVLGRGMLAAILHTAYLSDFAHVEVYESQ